MQVEMSLAEMLMNAIAHGDVHGIQWKRGSVDEKKTFADLNAVIGRRLHNALTVAREGGFRQAREFPNSPLKLRRERDEARNLVRDLLAMWDASGPESCDPEECARAAVVGWDQECK